MRRVITFLFLVPFAVCLQAQLKSPEQFLGYKIGTHFTPHWKVVNYFQYIANSSPTTVKIEQYGQTNEGRPLLVAFISTAENIGNLENIRKNNLHLANIDQDKAGAHEGAVEN